MNPEYAAEVALHNAVKLISIVVSQNTLGQTTSSAIADATVTMAEKFYTMLTTATTVKEN